MGASAEVRLLVAEDDPRVRRALLRLLRDVAVTAVGTIDELADEISAARTCAWVLDVWLHERSSLEVLEAARARGDSTPALVITADEDRHIANRVHLAGAEIAFKPDIGANVRAFVTRLSPPCAAAPGELAAARGNPRRMTADSRGTDSLIRRAHELGCPAGEIDVLLALERGVPRGRLAVVLSVSENTVKKAVARLLRRTGAENTAELIRTWLAPG